MNSIRVIIADDHAVVRTGLQLIFTETNDIELVDEVSSGGDLIRKISENDYDVVILDIGMPGKDVFDTLTSIKALKPDLPIVIFTMNKEEHYAVRMYKNGVSAFINKESNPELLKDAIRTVARGEKYYSKSQMQLMSDYIEDGGNSIRPHEKLSDREYQVLYLMASGYKKSEVAELLSVSKNTIDNHRKNILVKLKLKNNVELTRYALQNGIIQ